MFNTMNDGYNIENMARSGAGIYTTSTQFCFDTNMLAQLGFSYEQIQLLGMLVANYGKVTPNMLAQMGIPYESSRDIKYMYDICTGRVSINSELDLIKHLRRMFGKDKRIGISDLAVSTVKEVPRVAVVDGISTQGFTIYNSRQYKTVEERIYNVVDVTGGRIVVETNRRPQLKWGQSKKIDGVLEIRDVKSNGKLIIAFDKKVARLCNRFIVVGSLRRPEYHHGTAEIICIEGTKIYVYAQTLRATDAIRYNYGTQRVYDYGFFKPEIEGKLLKAAAMIYPMLCGVKGQIVPANQDFIMIPIEKEEPETEEEFDEDI